MNLSYIRNLWFTDQQAERSAGRKEKTQEQVSRIWDIGDSPESIQEGKIKEQMEVNRKKKTQECDDPN